MEDQLLSWACSKENDGVIRFYGTWYFTVIGPTPVLIQSYCWMLDNDDLLGFWAFFFFFFFAFITKPCPVFTCSVKQPCEQNILTTA